MITAYKTKTQTVFGKMPYLYSNDVYMANGKPLEGTYLKDWYQVEGSLISLVKVSKIKVNERYELINKELYNEKIPLMIDDSTKDKFKSLIDSELYRYVYDNEDRLEDIEFEVIEVDTETRFDIKTAKKFNATPNMWELHYRQYYLIELLEHSTVDMCLIPRPLLDLTRPCKLSGHILWNVLVDMIAANMPKNCRIINNNYTFEVKDINKTQTLIYWQNHWDKNNQTFYGRALFGNNFDDLIGRLNSFVEYIIKKLSEHDRRAIDVALSEMSQGKDFKEAEQ